jgi:uncharacterized protein YcaQ
MLHWTKEEARAFIVNYHMLNQIQDNTLSEVMDRLHMIQYDPLNVVGSNADLVLQARIANYKPSMLEEALYQTRSVIDGWDKQMSIIQTTDFPYMKRVRDSRANLSLSYALKYIELDATPYIDDVYDIIKTDGPIYSSEITKGERRNHKWGHTKASSVAIDYLFQKGLIGVHSRKNTQKRYDLIERLISIDGQEDPFPTDDAFLLWHLMRRIETVGLAWDISTSQFLGHAIQKKTIRSKYIPTLLKHNDIVAVQIEDIKGTFYIPKNALDIPIELTDSITFLAPLDNMIWDRKLVLELFDFDYVWEVYVPKTKRTYGYYVLPILRKDNIIGRIEFVKQRNNEPLMIQSLVWETNVEITDSLLSLLEEALEQFRSYLGASDIIYLG